MKHWIVPALVGLAFGSWQKSALAKPCLEPLIFQAVVEAGEGFQGVWNTNHGKLELRVQDSQVEGTYRGGTLSGSVEGRRLRFRYEDQSSSGRGWFQLDADGRSFSGSWNQEGQTRQHEWNGTFAGKLKSASPFEGLWETSFGRMRLVQSGKEFSGSYSASPHSSISGRMQDGKLQFEYREMAEQGQGWFAIGADGDSFSGQWRAEGADSWRGWNGRRVKARHGRVWLVILEAHWETELAESEFAFGDMLEQFFRMESGRHVAVRHRYFHDAADLQRFCHEVTYLAEPVLLVISTHGTEKGIEVAGQVIGAEAIAAGLQHSASNLIALHLSGCSMMNGPVPRQIQSHLSTPLTISGYSTAVAWDASALSDFMYLSLILIHGFEPSAAVAETHRLSPFTHDQPLPGRVYEPLGLKVLAAPK